MSGSETLTLSVRAIRQLKQILGNEPNAALRIAVKGGGCSGFQYVFEIENNFEKDDILIRHDGVCVVIDPISLEMLKGSELDFIDDLMGRAFKVKNPKATASCGCGVSFSL